MSVSVCLSLSLCMCVFVCPPSYRRNNTSDLHQIFVHATYGRGRSSSGGVVIRYVLPVLRMTSHLLISTNVARRRRPAKA